MSVPTTSLALALCVLLAPSSLSLPSQGLSSSKILQRSLASIDLPHPAVDRHGSGSSSSGSSSSGSSSSGSSSSGSSSSGSGSSSSSESGSGSSSDESSSNALVQILNGAAAGSDLLAVFAALALGSIPNPITNPVDFLSNPLISALTSATTAAALAAALADVVAALLSQLFFQPTVAIVAPVAATTLAAVAPVRLQ